MASKEEKKKWCYSTFETKRTWGQKPVPVSAPFFLSQKCIDPRVVVNSRLKELVGSYFFNVHIAGGCAKDV